jgi:NAD(P)-dependent dehydrogenase (short-subunit alcohol dehydrogenase family)
MSSNEPFIHFEGKAVVITGAGAGIGRVAAHELARLGAKLVIGDMSLERASRVQAEIQEEYGEGRALAVECDVRDYAAVKDMIAAAIEHFGALDVLINNAGTGKGGAFVKSKPEDWNFDLGVCLYGTMNCVHAALPHMIERGQGRIVNCCSDAGRVGEPYLAIYSAAKAGIVGFTKAVAKEVGKKGILMNCVCFGTTLTEVMQKVIPPELREKLAKGYALRRLGTMEDAANAMLLLASDRASFVTGQVLSSSGGFSMVD